MNRNKDYYEGPGFGAARGGRTRSASCPCGARPTPQVPTVGQEPPCNPARAEKTVPAPSRWGVNDRPVGSVYAPVQEFTGIYDKCRALTRGTIFAELDLPLTAAKGGCGCGEGGRRRG